MHDFAGARGAEVLDNPAVGEKQDPVGDRRRPGIVRDHHSRLPISLDGASEQIEDFGAFLDQHWEKSPRLVRAAERDDARGRRPNVSALRAQTQGRVRDLLDIVEAEQTLVAANANIGVARANYFPELSLTGSGGFQSAALSSLLTGPGAFFTVGASLIQPVFTAGRTRSKVDLAEAQRDEVLLWQDLSELFASLVGTELPQSVARS